MGALRSFLPSYPELLLAALCFLSLAALRLAVRARRQRAPVSWPVVGMLPFVLGNLGRLSVAEPEFRSWVFLFSKRVHGHHSPITAIEALLYSYTVIAQHPLPSSENADPEPCHHNMG